MYMNRLHQMSNTMVDCACLFIVHLNCICSSSMYIWYIQYYNIDLLVLTMLHKYNIFLAAHCMEQDMMTRLATGVFLRSVITILGSPPSATLQRYMCRNDLPWQHMTCGYSGAFRDTGDTLWPHLVISTISSMSGSRPRLSREKISFPFISISRESEGECYF